MNLRFHLIVRCHRVLLSMAALACTLPMTMPGMADDTTGTEEAPLGHDPLVSLMQELRAQVLNEANDPRSAINNCPGARKRLGLPFDPQARLPTPGNCEEMERHLLAAKVPLQVRAISYDGKPVDIASLAQIEVCDDTKCHAIQPLPDVKTVDGNTSGRATLLARTEIPAMSLHRVRIRIRDTSPAAVTESVKFSDTMDFGASWLQYVGGEILLSLANERNSTDSHPQNGWPAQDPLRLMAATAGLNTEPPADDPGRQSGVRSLYYNPAQEMHADLPEQTHLFMPPGALPGPAIIYVTLHRLPSQPFPSVSMSPEIAFLRPVALKLHAQEVARKGPWAHTVTDKKSPPPGTPRQYEIDDTRALRRPGLTQ